MQLYCFCIFLATRFIVHVILAQTLVIVIKSYSCCVLPPNIILFVEKRGWYTIILNQTGAVFPLILIFRATLEVLRLPISTLSASQ